MRDKPTAADSFEHFDAIDFDHFLELFALFQANPAYEVRPALQLAKKDGAVVKTLDNAMDAQTTLANLRSDIMFEDPDFHSLTEEQCIDLLNVECARETRKEVQSTIANSEVSADALANYHLTESGKDALFDRGVSE